MLGLGPPRIPVANEGLEHGLADNLKRDGLEDDFSNFPFGMVQIFRLKNEIPPKTNGWSLKKTYK